MFFTLFFLFAVLPILEITLLIQVGEQIGAWNTVGIVIITAFVGAYIVRQQGLSTYLQAQSKMQQGQLPGQEMAEGLLLLIAGVLLVTPGFVTDIIGFAFALPFTRPLIAKSISKHLIAKQVHFQQQTFYQHQSRQYGQSQQDEEIIEGEFRRTDTPKIKDKED